jgi:2,4-dienoyl-CoA reductase-like NADH-dependent reductase (Old Yellow Enzyme family)
MTAKLFTPYAMGPVEVPNRIVVAPMCQYTADDGSATDWHLQHWMTLAMSGAGLVVVEATAVERHGRITHGDLGLYSDANERAMARALAAAKAVALPGTKFGIQIAHAGRKASTQRPWEGGQALGRDEDPWQTIAPSAIAFTETWHTPRAMEEHDFARVKQGFVDAALRAARIGFDVVELHMAHGYLMHEIQSPLANKRDDRYGRDAAGRMSFLVETAQAVRAALPSHIPLGTRMTGQDWAEGGVTIDDAIRLAGALRDCGLAFACVSSGGVVAWQKIEVKPGYQVPFASAVKKGSGIDTRAVGMIAGPHQAEEILQDGHADQIALARAFLDDPRWGWHAADALGVDLPRPPQYARSARKLWPGAELRGH